MTGKHLSSTLLLLGLLCGALTGCSGGYDKSEFYGEKSGESGEEQARQGETEPEPLLEPFDPPPLDELNQQVTWQDLPVLDGMELLRQKEAEEERLASVEEALALRNNSQEANRKILSALGRLPDTETDVDWDATIHRHIGADIKSTNPIMASSVYEGYINNLTSFGLFTFDWNLEPYASAARVVSWQRSKDRLYHKVVMRDDLTWSDGEPITAHDVEFSFKTIMNPKVPVPAVRSGTDQLRWVEAYDDHTLVYFHKKPLATNKWNVNFPVIPKHIYEGSIEEDPTLQQSDYHVKYENNPVSGGPYILTERSRGQEVVLQRRKSWYIHDGVKVRDKPYFKEIRFHVIEDDNTALLALKNGDINEMELNPSQWTTQTDGDDFYQRNTKVTGTEWVYFYFGWNCGTPYFSDKRVRKAMSWAFDHEEMLDSLLYGLYEPSVGLFHPDAWMAPDDPPEPYTQNLDKAEQLLDEAGWTDHDGDGIRDKTVDGRKVDFEFGILCANIKSRIDICTLLKENLSRIGIICHVRPLEFTVLQQKARDHDFDAMFGGWGTGADPDTSENLWTTEAIEQGRNYVRYSNPKVDELFEEGKRAFDRERRADIYGEIHKILWEDQPYTWLYFRNSFYGFNKKLRGYMFSPRGPYSYDPGFGSIWAAAE